MNAPDRRQQIEGLLAKDPHDQFLRYALAMELQKAGEYAQSLEVFRSLMRDSTPHVPSFLMAAQYLTQRDEIEEARAILRDGIEEARRQGNTHAAGEMGELLATLGSAI
jgi:uncharacterized protein HemY